MYNLNQLANVFYDTHDYTSLDTDQNEELFHFVIDNMKRDEDGRIIVPALWNEGVKHLLPNNYRLASSILRSVLNKYKNDDKKLSQYNEYITKLIDNKVIERVNLHDVKNRPGFSFLAHNAVFRPTSVSTKCRVVLLANLCERISINSLSHNQISLPGPQLNSKISITCTLYRFNKYLFIFDIKQAFLQLALRSSDCDKLHFLWFEDIHSKNFQEIAYKFVRVPFGLRFSPFLLMVSLYYILVLNRDSREDSSLCDMLYNLSYMDNIAFSSSDSKEILNSYEKSINIFKSYCFDLQQFSTNLTELRESLEKSLEDAESEVKLFGMLWDKNTDNLICKRGHLDETADTRRKILSSLNSNFDPLGIYLPTLNRAKLFLHDLVVVDDLSWDESICKKKQNLWRNICLQFNNSNNIASIPRYVGDYNSTYNLVAFTDSSKDLYGVVLYLQNTVNGTCHFLMARNKIITKSLHSKSIPVLELVAVKFGVECLQEVRRDLRGAYMPLSILELHLYTDSMVAINWLHSKVRKFDKIEKKATIVNNALNVIVSYCNDFPIVFHHVDGAMNPADAVTRSVSAKVLSKSSFLSPPELSEPDAFCFAVPGDLTKPCNKICMSVSSSSGNTSVLEIKSFSSFSKLCRVVHYVRKFIYKLKAKVNSIDNSRCKNIKNPLTYSDSVMHTIRLVQLRDFPDVVSYLCNPDQNLPEIITQLNLFMDKNFVIRVRGKMSKLNSCYDDRYPVLFHKKSNVTESLVWEYHVKLKHGGIFKVLNMLRKEFYVPSSFSVVKRILRGCTWCRRLHGRAIAISQNCYQNFRINPAQVPFREVALDHIGPFIVKDNSSVNIKVYLLIVTCLYTRCINLLLCPNINNKSFLQALQIHVFQYGLMQKIISDNGSPIVSSINQIKTYMSDPHIINFLKERNIKFLNFTPYPSGASFLGGVVESLVKEVKKVLNSSLSKSILHYDDFYFLVQECLMLVNKRPVAYKSLLSDSGNNDDSVTVITPELLVKGYDVPTISIVPQLDEDLGDSHSCVNDSLFDSLSKLRSVKSRLNEVYHRDFIHNLREASTNKSERYKTVNHVKLNVGDLVAVRQKYGKPYMYPLGVVTNVEINDLSEVVTASLRKCNGEVIRRHASDLILIECASPQRKSPTVIAGEFDTSLNEKNKKRQAAIASSKITSDLYSSDLV